MELPSDIKQKEQCQKFLHAGFTPEKVLQTPILSKEGHAYNVTWSRQVGCCARIGGIVGGIFCSLICVGLPCCFSVFRTTVKGAFKGGWKFTVQHPSGGGARPLFQVDFEALGFDWYGESAGQ